MTLVYYVSWFATLNNILFFSTGIFTCRKIIRNNSTEHVSHLPFLVTAFSCFMWIMYGITKRDWTITFVNAIGMTLQCIYLICHFIYSKAEPVFKHTIYILLLTCSLLSYFKLYIPTEEESLNTMGMTCVIITVIMFGSPLVALANIFQTKSTESLSFPLCVMTVVNSSLWMSYGYLINDIYVIFIKRVIKYIVTKAAFPLFHFLADPNWEIVTSRHQISLAFCWDWCKLHYSVFIHPIRDLL